MGLTRFALIHSDTGQVESGANYPGCSEQNPGACDPVTFANIDDANTYAKQRGELLYVVGAAVANTPQWAALQSKVWQYVSNPALVPPPPPAVSAGGLDTSTLMIVGAGLVLGYFFL